MSQNHINSNKQLQNLNSNQIASGVALVSTAALGVYTVKNTIELNKKIDEIYEDLNKIKNFVTENQRKNNINTATLGKKIEEVQNKFLNYQPVRHLAPVETERVYVESKEEDDVDDAVNNFLKL